LEIQGKIKSAFIPQLPLEMAIVKAISGPENKLENAPTVPISPKSRQPYASSVPEAPISSKIASTEPDKSESNEIPSIENVPDLKENETIFEDDGQQLVSLNDIKKCWNQVIEEIKPLNHSLSAILQSCHPIKVEGDLISIAARFPFHKDKLNDNTNRLTLESVFAKILGFRLRINAITSQEAGEETQSSVISHQSSETKEQKLSETSSLLTDAMNIMGGAIVE
jgi:hypothetical protein